MWMDERRRTLNKKSVLKTSAAAVAEEILLSLGLRLRRLVGRVREGRKKRGLRKTGALNRERAKSNHERRFQIVTVDFKSRSRF